MIFIVTYDLHNPTRDYEKVAKVLQTANGGWAHPQGSVWFLDTTSDAATWRDRLKQAGDSNDEFFVARLAARDWASWNMDKDAAAWLKAPGRRW